MTNADLILETLEAVGETGGCDDFLSEELGITPRQQVNSICNRLAANGSISRSKDHCAHCGRRKMVNRVARLTAESDHRQVREAPAQSYAIEVHAPPLSEQSLDIERVRTDIVRMCRRLWLGRHQKPPPHSISRTITSLRDEGAIPAHQANMMMTLCGLRNVFVYEEVPMGSDEIRLAEAAWSIVTAWARSNPVA